MNISNIPPYKLDRALRDALSTLSGDDVVRAVMYVDGIEGGSTDKNGPSPSEFPSRKDYREFMIRSRRENMSVMMKTIVQSLQKLGLQTFGGEMTPTLVVQGKAKDLVSALQLSEVQHASLDVAVNLSQDGSLGGPTR